ncbi:MAG: type II secretion system F family protein [Actinomycetota bacterium]
MSSAYLILALVATFLLVGLASMRIGLSVAERRRMMRLLETQVNQVANLHHQDIATRSFLSRIVLPFVSRFASAARRITPIDARRRLERKLALVGSPEGWDAERLAAFKLIGGVGGTVLGLSLGSGGDSASTTFLLTALFGGLGYFGVDGILSGRIAERQKKIRRAMPDTMDLLTISVEAGLGFDAALAQVMKNVPGPLSQEIGRMLQEMRLGISRADAFRNLAERTDVSELNSFVLAMIQADIFGVSVSKVLRAQARELRTRRRQTAEEKAMKIPVKILFPLIFCILPALFVVIIGPGAIRIMESLFGIAP